MSIRRNRGDRAVLLSLEADAARGGFACLFSTSDEYERALISERRAQGRYGRSLHRAFEPLPIALFAACAMLVAGSVLLFVWV